MHTSTVDLYTDLARTINQDNQKAYIGFLNRLRERNFFIVDAGFEFSLETIFRKLIEKIKSEIPFRIVPRNLKSIAIEQHCMETAEKELIVKRQFTQYIVYIIFMTTQKHTPNLISRPLRSLPTPLTARRSSHLV